jgi:hypothetical protein
MSIRNGQSRRLFGGAEPQPSGKYDRPLRNNAQQATAESLAVGTHRRVMPGPRGAGASWSYFVSVTSAAGATSTLKAYVSNLPEPDPATAAHWEETDVSIDLTAEGQTFATRTDYAEWIKLEAVVANSAGSVLAFGRAAGVDE